MDSWGIGDPFNLFNKPEEVLPPEIQVDSLPRWSTGISYTGIDVPFSVHPCATKVRWLQCEPIQLTRLDAQAVAFAVGRETQNKCISDMFHNHGGPETQEEFERLKETRLLSGEAHIFKAYNLSSGWLIPFCGPMYESRYHRAVVVSLHQAIREVLKCAAEKQCTTVAIPMCYADPKHKFPRSDAIHTILRTTRRWMEKLPFESVVFYTTGDDSDLSVFGELLPLYFPRSAEEALDAIRRLPVDFNFGTPDGDLAEEGVPQLIIPPTGEDDIEALDFAPFVAEGAVTRENKDDDWQDRDLYSYYLRMSYRMGDKLWKTIQETCFLYVTHPPDDLPVVTFVGAHWPSHISHDLLMQFVVRTLDPIGHCGYTFLYVHSSASVSNAPTLQTLQEVMQLMYYRYKHTLRRFYILHPDWAVKAALALGWAFISNELRANVLTFDSIRELENVQGKVQLPSFVETFEVERMESSRSYSIF